VLGRPVAVKLLRGEYARHPQAVARFRAEARHASALSHPVGLGNAIQLSDLLLSVATWGGKAAM
jgi:hypothetical protein